MRIVNKDNKDELIKEKALATARNSGNTITTDTYGKVIIAKKVSFFSRYHIHFIPFASISISKTDRFVHRWGLGQLQKLWRIQAQNSSDMRSSSGERIFSKIWTCYSKRSIRRQKKSMMTRSLNKSSSEVVKQNSLNEIGITEEEFEREMEK